MSDCDDPLDSELDELLSEFSNSVNTPTFDSSMLPKPTIENLDGEQDFEKYTTDKMQEFLACTLDVTKTLLLNAKTTGDPELLNSITGILNANTKVLDAFNKRVINDKNNKNKIEVQKLKDNKEKQQIIDGAQGMLAKREEAFRKILQDTKEKNVRESIPAEEVTTP